MNISLFLEIKDEYTEHLVDTIAPFIYEGLVSIYKEAVRIADKTNHNDKCLLIFQKLLLSINDWNQSKLEDETSRIKQNSNTNEYLDDLIRATIKTNIILLTYSNNISNMIAQSFYNTFNTATFIHRCYTECAKDAHNNPYLFYHDIEPMDLKRNQIMIQQNIKSAIIRAMRKILPISMILKEYLANSINIINELPKIELIGAGANAQPPVHNVASKMENKLEKEVLNIIRTDNIKTDKQKIQDILNMDKMISSANNKKSIKSDSKNAVSIPEFVAPNIDNNDITDIENANLKPSEKKLLHIKFDDQTTISEDKNRHISATNLSGNPINKNVDKLPENSDIIETYRQLGGKNRVKRNK